MILEDDPCDVLRKAMGGHGLDAAALARAAGVEVVAVEEFLSGRFDPDLARMLAPALSLDADALAGLPGYAPMFTGIPGIDRLEFPFPGGWVNAWLLQAAGSVVLIDAGYEPLPLIETVLARAGRMPDMVVITHGHHDHVGAVGAFAGAGVPVIGWSIAGAAPCHPGDECPAGRIGLRACDLSGHHDPALGFHIHGFERPVLAVGDALFAGSMGRCRTQESQRKALATMRACFLGMPDETILLPGHGPATTLGDERRANPFRKGMF